MFSQTHSIIASSIKDNIKKDCLYELDHQAFTWGNVKPDIVPPLLFRKHYIEESLDFVVEKIHSLSRRSPLDILEAKKKKTLDREIGVVCHFISDFFCIPHHYRWEFKHSMIPHVLYEYNLQKKAKEGIGFIPLSMPRIKGTSREAIRTFLQQQFVRYKWKQDQKRDLHYSILVGTSIVSFILRSIFARDKTEKLKAYLKK